MHRPSLRPGNIGLAALALPLALALQGGAGLARADDTPAPPTRAPVQGCTWQHLADAKVGLAAWVQQCDFGFRQITLSLKGNGLVLRYSDGGDDETLVEVRALAAGETLEAGMRRVWAVGVAPAVSKHCRLAPDSERVPPAGVKRYTFVPDPSYAKQLAAAADPNDVPEPPCGERGIAPDGEQYFETHPDSAVRAFLFVQIGQDQPLFDEQTLQLLEKTGPARP